MIQTTLRPLKVVLSFNTLAQRPSLIYTQSHKKDLSEHSLKVTNTGNNFFGDYKKMKVLQNYYPG